MTFDELIAALKAATWPNRDLDEKIEEICNCRRYHHNEDGKKEPWPTPEFTESINDALTLVPEGWAIQHFTIWPGVPASLWLLQCGKHLGGKWWYSVGKEKHLKFYAEGATPAIALCIAALKARKAIEND